jgi:PST family polysaccharide transporter/lipopolysaccharide exporter
MTKFFYTLPIGLQRLLSGKNLKARVARGSVVVAAGSGIDQGLRLVRNVILTRLLAPEAFGLMAIVLAVNTFFESFTDVGIDTAIVQNAGSEDAAYLNGAWWISFGRAVGLYALVFAEAPWIGHFYRQGSIAALMRVAFLGTLFRGAMSPRTYVAHKKMDFKRLVAINQGAGLCGILLTVVLALAIPGVWALTIGYASEAAVRCMLSFVLCPYRPGLQFDKAALRRIYDYSRGLFGMPILTFIYLRADIFVIGKLESTALLGIYSMVAGLGRVPLSLAGTPMAQIVNPAFSEIQNNPDRLRSTLLRITSAFSLVSFPTMVLVGFYGKDLLLILYGARYAQAAEPLAVIFVSAMLGVASVPVLAIYFMTGRPQLNRFFAVVRTVLILILIYPATRLYGVIGAAAAVLASMVVACGFQVVRLQKVIGLNPWQYMGAFARGFPYSLPIVAVWLAAHGRLDLGPLAHFVMGSLACLAGFVAFLIRQARRDSAYQN